MAQGTRNGPSPLLQSRLSPTCQEAASSRKTSLTPSPQAASWLLSHFAPRMSPCFFSIAGRREGGGVFSLRGCDGGRQGGPCRDRPSVRGGWSRGTTLQRPLVETLPVTSPPAAWDVLVGSREGMRRGGCPKTPPGAAPSRERRGVLGRARVLIPSVASRCLPPVWVECAGGLGDRGPWTRDRQGMVPPGQWQRRPWGVGHPWRSSGVLPSLGAGSFQPPPRAQPRSAPRGRRRDPGTAPHTRPGLFCSWAAQASGQLPGSSSALRLHARLPGPAWAHTHSLAHGIPRGPPPTQAGLSGGRRAGVLLIAPHVQVPAAHSVEIRAGPQQIQDWGRGRTWRPVGVPPQDRGRGGDRPLTLSAVASGPPGRGLPHPTPWALAIRKGVRCPAIARRGMPGPTWPELSGGHREGLVT